MKELKAYIILFITIVTIGTLAIVSSDNNDMDQKLEISHVYEDGSIEVKNNVTDEIIFYEVGDF